jgi:hypothetical protein
MKNTKKNNGLKLGIIALTMLGINVVSAQRMTSTASTTDFGKQANTVLGSKDGSVKVIDNKGTIKYLQSKNGITMLTDKTPDGGVITTWQLGGALTDNTYIDATGKVFAIDGVKLITSTDLPSKDATTGSVHGTGTGFTLLVRDEATGETKKMLATDLVSGIRTEYTQVANATADVAITVTGLPVLTAGTTDAKLFVYRNGAKLRSGIDFVATADLVTITYSATDLPMYTGDVIEIQFIK